MNKTPKSNYKNAAKVMLCLLIGVVIVAIIIEFVIPALSNQLAIDRCLDKGGSFDHQTGECVGVSS